MRKVGPVIALAGVLSLGACSGMSTTQQRALSGGAIGAGVGAAGTAITGGCVACGAAIGGAAGVAGGLIVDAVSD